MEISGKLLVAPYWLSQRHVLAAIGSCPHEMDQ